MTRCLELARITAVLVIICTTARPAHAFTQSGVGAGKIGNGIPMGHEWITRLAALEVLGGDALVKPDPQDPRSSWPPEARARNLTVDPALAAAIRADRVDDDRYGSQYEAVFDAIIGERWVDTGGFNVAKSKLEGLVTYNCFDDAAQEPADVQYDHFMRRFDDRDGEGAVRAARESQQRFSGYFVAAAMAEDARIRVSDGGTYSSRVDVDRNWFLFGRAVHLFQDSFSSEHTVRLPDDWYRQVRQVKSYMCAAGSEQHTHALIPTGSNSGDVIWKPGTTHNVGWRGYKPSLMKPTALAATEASKDLWAAFVRVMAVPRARRRMEAEREAAELVRNWLHFDEEEMRTWYDPPGRRGETYVLGTNDAGRGKTVVACAGALPTVMHATTDVDVRNAQIEMARRVCLYNIEPVPGYADLADASLRLPFNWQWKTTVTFKTPPDGWQIPVVPPGEDAFVGIRSVQSGGFMTAALPLRASQPVRVAADGTPLALVQVGTGSEVLFRARWNPNLFLAYDPETRNAQLSSSTTYAKFRLDPQPAGGFAIFSAPRANYFWLDGVTPRLNEKGHPANADARWEIVRR